MEMYDEILKQLEIFKSEEKSISEIGHSYNFEILPTENDENIGVGDRYTIFKARKEVDEYVIELQVDTRDKYRSFGNDEEPYFNEIRILKNNKVLKSEEYIYFE